MDLATFTIILIVLFFSVYHKRVVLMILFLEYLTLMNLFSVVFLSLMSTEMAKVVIYVFLACAALEAGLGLALLVGLSRSQDLTKNKGV